MMTPDKPNLVKLTEGDMMAMPAIQPYEPVRDAINVVEPMNGYGIGPEEDNFGFYVIGPTSPAQFGMGGSGKKPTMKIRDERPSSMPGMPAEGLTYEIPQSDPLVKDPKMLGQLPEHVVVLRHLCCPAMKPDSSPTMTDGRPNPLYNPYVTVDVMENVKIWDAVRHEPPSMVDGHAGRVQEKDRYSRGRNQPYAGHRSHLVDQKPNPMGEDPKITNDKIQGSFFRSIFRSWTGRLPWVVRNLIHLVASPTTGSALPIGP